MGLVGEGMGFTVHTAGAREDQHGVRARVRAKVYIDTTVGLQFYNN